MRCLGQHWGFGIAVARIDIATKTNFEGTMILCSFQSYGRDWGGEIGSSRRCHDWRSLDIFRAVKAALKRLFVIDLIASNPFIVPQNRGIAANVTGCSEELRLWRR
jgi:hypothetical protein